MNTNGVKPRVFKKSIARFSSDNFISLRDAVQELVEQTLAPKQAEYASIYIALQKILPHELLKHCKINDFSQGCLRVVVDEPAYMHELQLCKLDLLILLQDKYIGDRLKDIRFNIG